MSILRPILEPTSNFLRDGNQGIVLFSNSSSSDVPGINKTALETNTHTSSTLELASRTRLFQTSSAFKHALKLGDLEIIGTRLPYGINAQTTIELDLETNKRKTIIELGFETVEKLFSGDPAALQILNEEIAHANQSVIDPTNLSLSEYTIHRLFQELSAQTTSQIKAGKESNTQNLITLGHLIKDKNYTGVEDHIRENGLLPKRYEERYKKDYDDFVTSDNKKIVQRNYSLADIDLSELTSLPTYELAQLISSRLDGTLYKLLEDGDERIVNFLGQMEIGVPYHIATINAGFKSVFEADAVIEPFLHEHSGLDGTVDLIALLKGHKSAAIREVAPAETNVSDNGNTGVPVIHVSKVLDTNAPTEPGIVRDESKLSNKQVVELLNNQVETVSTHDVKEIVNSFGTNRTDALLILSYLTQFGNMASLNSLAKQLVALGKEENFVVLAEGKATLADNLYYLSKREVFPHKLPIKIVESFNSIKTSEEKGYAFIVDKDFLHRLNSDPALVSHLKQLQQNGTKLKFVIPASWDRGINVFNQCTDIRTKIEEAHGLALEAWNLGVDKQEGISCALTSPIKQNLTSLGFKDENIQIIENREINHETPSIIGIASNLSSPKILEGKLKEILKHLPADYRNMAREIIARDAVIFSPKKLSRISKEQRRIIEQAADKQGIDRKDIFYYVLLRSKSYGMATMNYIVANDIPQSQVITHLDKLSEKPLVVVLDNFAGTGESHLDVYNATRENGYIGNLLFAPTLSTAEAKGVFDSLKKYDEKLEFLPGTLHTEFPKSDYYQALNLEQRAMYEKIIDYLGYGELGLCVVFPYTAPNNNNRWFNNNFAPLYTLNGKGIRDYEEDLKKGRKD